MRQHSMQCPMALQRLVVVGLPATVEHGGGRSATSNSSAAVVAEITAAFITCLDSVRLNMLAVDQVPTRLPHCCPFTACLACHECRLQYWLPLRCVDQPSAQTLVMVNNCTGGCAALSSPS